MVKERKKCPYCGKTGEGHIIKPLSESKKWICPNCGQGVEII